MIKMKLFKLIVHQKNFCEDDLIFNPKDYPGAREGDVVEIYHMEESAPRLLLQIPTFKEDLPVARDTISVEQSIAATFQLRTYADVCVQLVTPLDVALDSVELTFKDQYMGRSEMWRLKNGLVNTCVYLNKKIEFCKGAIRCQVYEMWSQGDRVACGVITDDTKVVFRSSTSMVYLFLQMSSEMWDFDIHGDLYFEKAVNGFLADLFAKWKKHGSNHEVTIVLFSRTFYKATCLEEFPQYMRECLQLDYRGRFYEDFYRVAVQNERFDDWSHVLVQLRRLFSDYQRLVLRYHEKPGVNQHIPPAMNSTAAQGNFLEVLNMSLNVFEKHYLERSLDRTGQLSVVVTPGVGVFEVDRELTNVTKQRIIDNGVGSDLVCVGEQPLHAVPLLKFHNKDTSVNAADDYSMPHWINLSFYSTNKKVAYSNFIPRIKLPPRRPNNLQNGTSKTMKTKLLSEDERIHNSFFDYDAYDAQVFQLPPAHGTSSLQRIGHRNGKKTLHTLGMNHENNNKFPRRKMSDPDIHRAYETNNNTNAASSQAINIPPSNYGIAHSPLLISPISEKQGNDTRSAWTTDNFDSELLPPSRAVIGSAGSPPPMAPRVVGLRPGRALINPFDPSHVTIKLTSNRRRWTHIFPKGPTGVLIQQHHYQAVPTQSAEQKAASDNETSFAFTGDSKKRPNSLHTAAGPNVTVAPSKSLALLWGATGEQEWTPALTTGVDWKSLTIPACLPITTDYFPDKRALQNDYVVSDYNLLPDDVNADFAQQRAIYKKPLTTPEVFKELVSQRLAQGFQLIILPNVSNASTMSGSKSVAPQVSSSIVGTRTVEEPKEEYLLSIGRVFHRISLSGSCITVTRYRPRHPYPPFNIHYRYRFHAPHHDTYEVSWVSFTTEKLENYNWNYLDHYICTRGDTDFALVEALKYWRFRVYLLPTTHPATKKILDGSAHCDIYMQQTAEEQNTLNEGFLRFMEMFINRIKRPNTSKKTRAATGSPSTGGAQPPNLVTYRRYSMSVIGQMSSQTSAGGSSPFRERLGSNRLPERPRPRSGSKVMERGRVSPATEAVLPTSPETPTQGDDSIDDSQQPIQPTLKANSTLYEILEAMCKPNSGVGFLACHPSLPSMTFVSADAVNWLIANLESTTVDKAMSVMQNMCKQMLVCHASGDFNKPFVFGFYLYYIVDQDKSSTDFVKPLGDLQNFENEWLEVEIREPQGWGGPGASRHEANVPHFLCGTIHANYLQGDCDNDTPLYKHTHLETDVTQKSDRVEWGHARYQTVYRPDQAYELVVQWVASSAAIVSELISNWQRKAQICGLQMIPIPADLLALPFAQKSDPLRGPIFIPLDIDCLMKNRTYLFEEFKEETWADRLFLFQESIVARFGFMPCSVEAGSGADNSAADAMTVHDHQYVHFSGNMFILIPSPPAVRPARQRLASVNQRRAGVRYPMHHDTLPSPHHAYITRHVSGKNKDNYGSSRKMGFLWSWNHMLSKRWRSCSTPAAGDDAFQTHMLRDFREFCSNVDGRLRNYWDRCWELKEYASL